MLAFGVMSLSIDLGLLVPIRFIYKYIDASRHISNGLVRHPSLEQSSEPVSISECTGFELQE